MKSPHNTQNSRMPTEVVVARSYTLEHGGLKGREDIWKVNVA